VAGVRVRPAWTLALYGVLAASAGLSVVAQRSPGIDPAVGKAAAWVFLVFAVGFTGYRLALVVARRYSPFKAFLQVLIAALFFLLLLVPAVEAPPRAAGRHALLGHPEPAVRALAARVIGLERDASGGPELVGLLRDPAPEVRGAAHQALVELAGGSDLGDSPEAWRGRFP
jgi:HEAT repeats